MIKKKQVVKKHPSSLKAWLAPLSDIDILSRFCSTRTGSLSAGTLPWWNPSRLRRTSSLFLPSENLDFSLYSPQPNPTWCLFSLRMKSGSKAFGGPGQMRVSFLALCMGSGALEALLDHEIHCFPFTKCMFWDFDFFPNFPYQHYYNLNRD